MMKDAGSSPNTSDETSTETEYEPEPGLGTHQVSVVDGEGNVCSLTHTVYGGNYGTAGLFVGGIPLNGAGMFRAQPGERIVSPVCPLIVFKGEKPYFATGSSGSILNTFFTTLNAVVWEMDFKAAQEAPRFRPPEGHAVTIENRIEDWVVQELVRRGYRFDWAGPYSYPFGGAQMAGIDPVTGVRLGATDPRFLGLAAGEDGGNDQ
jgi:gamma-glutamyltranspeptidase/glutathione hydrolase